MKKIARFLPLLMLALFSGSFYSCEKLSPDNQAKGKLEIAFDISEGMLKSAISDTTDLPNTDTIPEAKTFHILISVENRQGALIMEDEIIPLFNFGSGFVSQKIEFEPGEYRLVKFMVINPLGKVVFAAPLEGSPKAYLVMKPLPLAFAINSESITRVIPEVLAVINENPQDFGYAGFGFHVVKPLPFFVMAINDDPRIMAPSQAIRAKLTVIAPSGWQYSFELEAKPNKLILRGGEPHYMLIAEKEGFPPVKIRLSPQQIMNTSPERPFIIPFGSSEMNVLKLKPGPQLGKDAMISNLNPEKNFGEHRYFEATFISEPILTVMRSNNSLISFDMGQLPKSATIRKVKLLLYYENIISWDYQGGASPISSDRPWYGAVLQKIVEPWDEYKVTWNNQPRTIEANQVYITPFNSIMEIRADGTVSTDVNSDLMPEPGTAGMLEVDVTSLYVPFAKENYPNYGMFFKLYPTEQFPGFRFASSDHPNVRLHPELIIHYTLPE
jgi:hypothetical protein